MTGPGRLVRRWAGWLAYAVFAIVALMVHWHPDLPRFSSASGPGKALVWVVLAGFLAYSVVCSLREPIAPSLAAMARTWWGRQVGIDLYLGLGLFLVLVQLHLGDAWLTLAWALPVLLFANLATLLYVAIHYESLLTWLGG
ncbi:MAG: hypothetical protein KDJ14_04075 [Xanthomonadales bacterium]|nr:hypothetical protein [Xanthomonadales bacterium]